MARARILQPYTPRVEDTRHRVSRIALVGALVLLAMLMGFVIAILPMNFMIIPMFPILVLALLALWLAPDMDRSFDASVRKLVLLYFAMVMVWPDYIAYTMPGIGWVNPQRLTMGLLFFTSLFALSTSASTRAHVYDVISHVKPVYWFFLSFFILQWLLAFATFTFTTRFIYSQFVWYYIFILAAWTFSINNTIFRFYQLILVGFAIQCFYGMFEEILQYPMWAPYIPSWLMVDSELLERIVGDSRRAGTDVYRIASLYFTSVTFGEAIGLFVPFVTFAIFYARNAWFRGAAMALLVFAFLNAIWSDSRAAMVGFIIGTVGIIGLWALQRFKKRKAERDIIAPAVVWAFPFGLAALALAILTLGRVRVAVLGGGQHLNSNLAREEQWRRTFELLERNPLGYGPFTAGDRVGYANPSGQVTIDGFAMNLLVDYGILGITLFVLFFASCIYVGIRAFLNSESREEDLAAPLAVALTAFLVIKLVLSQTENHHIVYAFAGCIVALHWRQEQRRRLEQTQNQPDAPIVSPATPFPPRPATGGYPGGYGVARAR